MAKNKSLAVISLLLLLLLQLAHSRSIREGSDLVSDGSDSDSRKRSSIIEWGLSAETCEPAYGFLPCSTNVWGLLFLIVVYEILLSIGGQYVGAGSEKFFEIIGPGVFGASLFQFLGTFPQIIVVLESALSGSREAAQQRTTLGMGLVAGTAVMLLTLVWGVSVVLGSYDLSAADDTADNPDDEEESTLKGQGIVTDAETRYTSRIILISIIPFLILQLQNFFSTSSGRRAIILFALIVTFILLFAYIGYQIFEPWIQNRRFELLMSKYAKDKLMELLTKNGKPDTQKILRLFNRVDTNKNAALSAAELRVLLLGAKIDDEDDFTTDRNIENILASFDISGDGLISREEFVRGMRELVSNFSNLNADKIQKGGKNSDDQNTGQIYQGLLAKSSQIKDKFWFTILEATFLVTFGTFMLCVLGEPLIKSVVGFARAANLSSFSVSYLAIPFAMNYGTAVRSIASARQKTKKSISLTLSALYGGIFMNNIIGSIVFLTPVYARDLLSDVSAEVLVVLIICVVMTILTCLRTTFPVWVGYLVLLLYPISLALVYLLTVVYGWS